MSAAPQTHWQYLERDPLSTYRQLSVKGRRIKARTLYGAFMNAEEPRTIEQIAADWDLPIDAVREAIAYCRGNPNEIRQDFEREERLLQAAGMDDPSRSRAGGRNRLTPQQIGSILESRER